MQAPKTVADIMTKEVVSVSPTVAIAKIAGLMVEHHLTGVPVVDADGKIVGIVTDKDLVAQKSSIHIPSYVSILGTYLQLSPSDQVEHEIHKILGATADEIMTKSVVTTTPDAPVKELATLMLDKGVNPVPVVDTEQRVVGVVSRYDLARLLTIPQGA